MIGAGGTHLAEAWFNRGVALEMTGDLPSAYAAFSQAVAHRPDWGLAQRELSRFSVVPGS